MQRQTSFFGQWLDLNGFNVGEHYLVVGFSDGQVCTGMTPAGVLREIDTFGNRLLWADIHSLGRKITSEGRVQRGGEGPRVASHMFAKVAPTGRDGWDRYHKRYMEYITAYRHHLDMVSEGYGQMANADAGVYGD